MALFAFHPRRSMASKTSVFLFRTRTCLAQGDRFLLFKHLLFLYFCLFHPFSSTVYRLVLPERDQVDLLILKLLSEAKGTLKFVDNVDQDQTAQNVLSDIHILIRKHLPTMSFEIAIFWFSGDVFQMHPFLRSDKGHHYLVKG